MPQVFESKCLYSTVRNVSGVTKRFPFLPPHGRQLLANEEASFFGDIREAVIRSHRNSGRRNQVALQVCLTSNPPLLEIVHTPNPILEDQVSGGTLMLELRNGQLVSVDPCWQQSVQTSDSTQPAP